MQALKIKLFQETASYTKPFAFKVGETYPLPPYSTVIGFLHRVLEATEYHDMKVSVQGTYEDKFVDLRQSYLYKSSKITQSPLNQHLLYGVNLILHVSAEEKILQELYQRLLFCQEFLSLGRKEDLVRIDDVGLETLQVDDDIIDDLKLKHDIYIPVNQLDYLNLYKKGIRYRLHTRYQLIKDMRIWEHVDVAYFSEGSELGEDEYLFDSEGDVVYFHTPLS